MAPQRMNRVDALVLVRMSPAVSATEVTLPVSGAKVPCLPMSLEDFLGQQFGRFASVRDVVVGPMRAIAEAQRKGLPEGVDASDEKAVEAAVGAVADGLYDPFDSLGGDATESTSSSIAAAACFLGFAGDREIESAIATWDPDDLDFYVAQGDFRTWGADPGPFYQRALKGRSGTRNGRPAS